MGSKVRIPIEPGRRFRRHAGTYDLQNKSPLYSVEVVAPSPEAERQVSDDSEIMGSAGNHFWVWNIKNNSSSIVYVTLLKDGMPV